MNCQRVNAAVQQGYGPEDPSVGYFACIMSSIGKLVLKMSPAELEATYKVAKYITVKPHH